MSISVQLGLLASRRQTLQKIVDDLDPLNGIASMLRQQIAGATLQTDPHKRRQAFAELTTSTARYLEFCEAMLEPSATDDFFEPMVTLTHWTKVSIARYQHLAGDFVLREMEDFPGHETLSAAYRQLNAALNEWHGAVLRSAPLFVHVLREQAAQLDARRAALHESEPQFETIQAMTKGFRLTLDHWITKASGIREEVVMMVSLQSDLQHELSTPLIEHETFAFLAFLDAIDYVNTPHDVEEPVALSTLAAEELETIRELRARRDRFIDAARADFDNIETANGDNIETAGWRELPETFTLLDAPAQHTVLVVQPHPDDETTKGGRTTAQFALDGSRTVLVCMTDGSAGSVQNPSVDTPNTQWNFSMVRRHELITAARHMGFSVVEALGYGDSGMQGDAPHPLSLASQPHDQLVSQLAELISRYQPQVLLTVQPEEEQTAYGHPDHLITYRVTKAAWEMAALPNCEMWATSLDESLEELSDIDMSGSDSTGVRKSNELPRAHPIVTVETSAEAGRRRVLAMHAHATQIDPRSAFFTTTGNDIVAMMPSAEQFYVFSPS